MSDDSDQVSKVWKSAAMLLGLGFIFAASWGYSQSQRAGQLEDRLQSLTAEANTKLQALSKLDIPVSVSFGKPFLSNDIAATFKNNSSKPLEAAAVITSSATGRTKELTIVIPPNSEKTILKGDDWEFAAGQTIKLSNKDYRELTFTIP